MLLGTFRRHILPYWKSIVVITAPLLLLPLPLLVNTAVIYRESIGGGIKLYELVAH